VNSRTLAAGLSLVGVAACDPCSGVGGCGAESRIAIEGTLVEHVSGQPSPGVRIDVIRTGGVELTDDSMSTVSGSDGHWQVSAPARDAGDVTIDINVHLPGVSTYRVRGVHLNATDRLGDGVVLPTWVVDPYFAFAAELYYRATQDTRVDGATVEFHRTGGIAYTVGNGGQVFVGKTDAAGRIGLFDVFAHTANLGDLVGDLVVHFPMPIAADTVRGLHLGATQLLHAETQIIRLGVGPPFLNLGDAYVLGAVRPVRACDRDRSDECLRP